MEAEKSADAGVELRFCTWCARSLPVTQFRWRQKATGELMSQCRACNTNIERIRRHKKRALRDGRAIQLAATQIARSSSLTRSINLLNRLVITVGGPEELVTKWAEECRRLTSRRRSSTRLARMYEMLISLATQLSRSS